MSAFKGVRSQKPIPDFKQQLAATLTQNVKPSSLRAQPFKPAETQSDTDSSGSSRPSHHVSVASIKAARMNYNRLGSTTVLKPETKESHVPSFPKVRQRIKPPLAQRLTNRDDGVENIIRAKPPKLPEMQNYIRICRTQTKVQRVSFDPSVPKKRLPDVLLLGSPPPKPQRPPSVDIHRFRGSLTCVNDGRDDLKQEEEAWPIIYEFEAEQDIYDDLGAPAEVCSGLNVQNKFLLCHNQTQMEMKFMTLLTMVMMMMIMIVLIRMTSKQTVPMKSPNLL
ncbi:uncharacterized protein LOC119492444 isoform X3 [Sebastes umbrosus]|uniref:uncharacterized protein LOC119492444 isoform X3 n=1 Tax=Sebastes umbrosus TaxID=72105 RepID=UPI00189E8E63|nr:uncharacterized protein LOC119492444 isoform X3 [Sebastes umbrosus]